MVTTQFLRSHVIKNGFLTRHWYDRIGAVDVSIGDVGSHYTHNATVAVYRKYSYYKFVSG